MATSNTEKHRTLYAKLITEYVSAAKWKDEVEVEGNTPTSELLRGAWEQKRQRAQERYNNACIRLAGFAYRHRSVINGLFAVLEDFDRLTDENK